MNVSMNATPKPPSAETAQTHPTAPPREQAARHGTHNDVLHEVRNMDRVGEGIRDEKLLGVVVLDLLDHDIIAHGETYRRSRAGRRAVRATVEV